MPRMRSVVVLTAALLSLGLAGCAADGPQPTPSPSRTATPVAPSGDGVLRIGTVTDAAASGAAIVAGVELAVRQINDAGGVAGVPVEVFHRAASNPTAVTELTAKGADVLILGSTVVLDPVEGVELVTVTPATMPDEQLLAELQQIDPSVADLTGAADALEATIAAALAAVVAGDDGGDSIGAALDSVRSGTAECASFGECLAAIDDEFTIAYAPRWS